MANWFAWNGVACTDKGVYVREFPPFIRPKERAETIIVPGRSGTLTRTEGKSVYDEFIAPCECSIRDPALLPAFSAWLDGPGLVQFGNRATGFYYARVANQIDFAQIVRGRQNRNFVVNFRCQPFMYLLDVDDIVLLAPDTVTNGGTVFAEPIIKVVGSGDITLTVGDVVLEIDNLADEITIDVPQKIAYKGAVNLTGSLTGDEWPILPTGDTAISWTGTVTNVWIRPNWREL